MGFRTVYGNDWSENGWRMCNRDECDLVHIPELYLTETAPLRKGAPLTILGAWLYWYDRNVEEIISSVWGWSEDNYVANSNHLAGTAVDVNAPKYPWGTYRMPAAKIAKVEEGMRLFEGSVFWGRVWSKPDEMHYQMAWAEGDPRNDAFAKKLLDGYLGIYKQAPGGPDAAQILADAMGNRLSLDRYRELLPAVSASLRACECTNVNRIAMWCAQIGHESSGLFYTEEIASGQAYEGRTDLGNTQPGDGVRFKGRSWIQITGRSNYTRLSQWAFAKGLIPTSTYFVDNPTELAADQYAGLGAAWYWVVARPAINGLSDNRDLTAVTQLINGGQNGIDDRRARYDRALSMGDQLLTLISGEDDFLSALNDSEQRELLDLLRWIAAPGTGELRKVFSDRSMYRTSNDRPDTIAGRGLTAHAFGWDYRVESAAYRGELWALDLVAQAARGVLAGVLKDDGTPDQFLVAHATYVLNDLETNNPKVLQSYVAQKGLA